ncbi:hypothetical protein [Rhodococcus sp. Eu-32]|nr:hypothetical protein [Rhodococcus sp. Eu-32]
MQSDKAAQLHKKWIDEGNKHCDHPKTEREYYLGTATGDRVCTTCGADYL